MNDAFSLTPLSDFRGRGRGGDRGGRGGGRGRGGGGGRGRGGGPSTYRLSILVARLVKFTFTL